MRERDVLGWAGKGGIGCGSFGGEDGEVAWWVLV